MDGLGTLTGEMTSELEEMVKTMSDLIEEQVKGLWPGTRETRGDDEFRAWFLMKVGEWGPDFIKALEFVDGGKAVLRRWNKIVAERVIPNVHTA